MVAKCANPRCQQKFEYLSQGKLYVFGHNSIQQILWLCPQCASAFELIADENSNPVLSPRSLAGERKPGNASISVAPSEQKKDGSEVAQEAMNQSLIEWTVDWLKKRERPSEPDSTLDIMERRAGAVCKRSGVHRVIHDQHRAPHQAIVQQGEVFPTCRGCGPQVRFEFLRPLEAAGEVEHIGYDWDFVESLWGLASGDRG